MNQPLRIKINEAEEIVIELGLKIEEIAILCGGILRVGGKYLEKGILQTLGEVENEKGNVDCGDSGTDP